VKEPYKRTYALIGSIYQYITQGFGIVQIAKKSPPYAQNSHDYAQESPIYQQNSPTHAPTPSSAASANTSPKDSGS